MKLNRKEIAVLLTLIVSNATRQGKKENEDFNKALNSAFIKLKKEIEQ
jgi:hypothetical protein